MYVTIGHHIMISLQIFFERVERLLKRIMNDHKARKENDRRKPFGENIVYLGVRCSQCRKRIYVPNYRESSKLQKQLI